MTDLEKVSDILKNYRAYKLNAWELEFLEDVAARIDSHASQAQLSSKQKEVLERIWDKGE